MDKKDEYISIVEKIMKLYLNEENVQLKKRLFDAASNLRSIAQASQERGTEKGGDKTWTHKCQHCGKCCTMANDLLGGVSINDIAIWLTAKRFDILRWVDPIMSPSSEVVVFDIWIGPRTHDNVDRCPWLRKRKGEKLYDCAIHDIKPQVCRDFPVSIDDAKKFCCPGCQEKLPCDAGQEMTAVETGRDDD